MLHIPDDQCFTLQHIFLIELQLKTFYLSLCKTFLRHQRLGGKESLFTPEVLRGSTLPNLQTLLLLLCLYPL